MRDELFFSGLSLVNWHGATSGNRIYCTGFMLLVYSTHISMFWPSDTHTLTTGAVCNGFLLLVFPGAIFDKTRCYPPMLKWQVVIHVDTHTHRKRENQKPPSLSLNVRKAPSALESRPSKEHFLHQSRWTPFSLMTFTKTDQPQWLFLLLARTVDVIGCHFYYLITKAWKEDDGEEEKSE